VWRLDELNLEEAGSPAEARSLSDERRLVSRVGIEPTTRRVGKKRANIQNVREDSRLTVGGLRRMQPETSRPRNRSATSRGIPILIRSGNRCSQKAHIFLSEREESAVPAHQLGDVVARPHQAMRGVTRRP
jgi:hypothetical protein